MRTLGWIFSVLLLAALLGGGTWGYFHYRGLVRERDELRAARTTLEADLELRRRKGTELEQKVTNAGKDLKATSAELEELRKRRADAERRLKMVEELTAKLKKMIDTGKLGVITRQGRMIVQMPAEVLFESGQAELSKSGQETLREVAAVLKADPDRRLIVAGHTDNQPIADADFRNNWDLSAARAVIVTELLVASGVAPDKLIAAGFGEYHPIGDNRTVKGRRLNRRIEIEIQPPELDALPELVEAVSKTTTAN